MDGSLWCVDQIDVEETGDEVTLLLAQDGAHVLAIRSRYPDAVEDVINSAGTVAAGAVSSWTLIDRTLTLELGTKAATTLGIPRALALQLDVDQPALRRVRAALLRILQWSCFIVDTEEGRVVG